MGLTPPPFWEFDNLVIEKKDWSLVYFDNYHIHTIKISNFAVVDTCCLIMVTR